MSVSFFAFCLDGGQLLRGKNLLQNEQIPSFKSGPPFESASFSRKTNRKSQKFSPFVKLAENHGDVPIGIRMHQ